MCQQPLAAQRGSDQARGLHGGHQRRVREEEGIARLLRMTRVPAVPPLLSKQGASEILSLGTSFGFS